MFSQTELSPFPTGFLAYAESFHVTTESLIAAEKETELIAVEVKSFLSKSALFDFHLAMGQFLNYRFALEQTEPKRKLFLAIPEDAYFDFFQRPFVQKILTHHSVALIVYNAESEVILLWL